MMPNSGSKLNPGKPNEQTSQVLALYITQVSVLSIAIPTCSDVDKALWMKLIMEAYKEDESGELVEKLKVCAILKLKGEDEDTPKPKAPGSLIGWEAFVVYKDKSSSDTIELGKNLAKEVTILVKTLDAYEAKIRTFVIKSSLVLLPMV